MAAWVLALVSCLHVTLAVVRQHRSTQGPTRLLLVGASYLFVIAAWLWTTPSALAVGLAMHVAWLLATDGIARGSKPPPVRSDGKPSTAARARVRPVAATSTSATPLGFVPLPVLAVIEETPDIHTFRLARAEGFDFVAGQFLPVRLRVDGSDHVRCYSISSAPHASGFVEISVKRQGKVSGALHATLRPGSALHARRPAGAFVYPAADDRPLVLLAAGVGITPLASMVRHSLHADPQRPVILVQSASRPEGLVFADEFRLLQRRHPTFRWVPAVSRGESGREYYPGRIDRGLLDVAVPGIAHSVVCICGPSPMIADACALLARLGVPQPQVRYELFEAAVAAAGAEAAATGPQPSGAAPVVTFSRSGAATPAAAGQTLLDVAEGTGVEIPSLCRAGVCGTCRTRVTSGDVHCQSTALDDDDVADGFVLACVSHARSDCAVDA